MGSTASCEEIAARASRLETLRLRLVETFDEPLAPVAETAVQEAERAVSALRDVDVDALDGAELRSWLEGIEELRRMVDAAAVAGAGRVDRSNPFRDQGFFSAKSVVKHMCRLSGPEAHRRVQTARLHEALPAWADAEADGVVGVAQSELMARIAANPRVPAAVLERDAPRPARRRRHLLVRRIRTPSSYVGSLGRSRR